MKSIVREGHKIKISEFKEKYSSDIWHVIEEKSGQIDIQRTLDKAEKETVSCNDNINSIMNRMSYYPGSYEDQEDAKNRTELYYKIIAELKKLKTELQDI